MIKFPLFRLPRAEVALDPNAPARLPVCGEPLRPHPGSRLAVYPLRSPAAAPAPASAYASLATALADGRARLHETDGLRETEVENLTDTDLFAQAGEAVRGGWQDWTLGVDLIVPRRSQRRRMSLREFCLYPGRWHFADRQEVSRAFGAEVPGAGPTLDKRLRRLPETGAEVVGFAYAVNGAPRGAHLYAHNTLFAELWPGVLERAMTEANLPTDAATAAADPLPAGLMSAWLARAIRGAAAAEAGDAHSVTPRVTLRARETAEGAGRLVCLETFDAGQDGVCLHQVVFPMGGPVGTGR